MARIFSVVFDWREIAGNEPCLVHFLFVNYLGAHLPEDPKPLRAIRQL